MKAYKMIAIVLALVTALSLVACSDSPAETTAPDPTTAPTAESTPEESTPTETTPESTPDDTEVEYPSINYMEIDLSEYLTLGQYKGFTIEIAKTVVSDDAVMSTINADLIAAGFTDKITDRAVTESDTVSISYKGLLDGVAFEGGTGDQDNFTIYDGGGFIPGFAEGLIGAMPGVEVDVNVTFPESYHSADLAGKAVVFKVTVHHIYEAQKLTDELVDEATSGSVKTVAELIESYREYLNEEAEEEYNSKKDELVWELLIENSTIVKNPDDIVNAFYDYELSYYQDMADMYGMNIDTLLTYYGYTKDSLKEAITASVINNIIIYSIIKAENMTITTEEYLGFIEDLGYTEEELLESYEKEELENIILANIANNTILEWQNYVEPETAE